MATTWVGRFFQGSECAGFGTTSPLTRSDLCVLEPMPDLVAVGEYGASS